MDGAVLKPEKNSRDSWRVTLSTSTNLSDHQLREQAIKLVQPLSTSLSGEESFPDIANRFGLNIQEGILPEDKDGAYLEDEKTIVLNSSVTSEERKSFSFYHELVHHLLRENDDFYSYLHEAYVNTRDFDNTIELLCNIGAAEIILPRSKVRSLIDSNEFSIKLVQKICDQGCVSGPAALIQLIQCAPNRCYGVVCEFGMPPYSDSKIQNSFLPQKLSNKLYILYSMWSPSAKYAIARFTTIPGEHLLMQTMAEQNFIKGKDKIPFRSGTKWQVPCEAIFFRGKVYGLFNVTPPPNRQQMRLF
jgi:hypothetical protein